MAAPDSNGNDADDKACNVAVQSAVRVPVSGDPMETFGSLGDMASDNVQFAEDEHGESTEYSSSFGTSCSGFDDHTKSDMNGMEVDSPFLGYINVDDTTSVPKMVRQKEVTAEWRKTVRPLIWRCQWLELRMKDLSSQVAKYDKELALIDHEKELQLEMLKVDGSNSELAKLDVQSHYGNTMKRRKRKRHEDTMDSSLYMKNHQILSYYNEKKNSGADDSLLINDGSKSVVVGDSNSRVPDNTLLVSQENDSVLEQYSLSEILLRIDAIQSQIFRLQGHLIKVRSKHEVLLSDVDQSQLKVPQKARSQIAYCKNDGNRPQKKRNLHSLLQKEDICGSHAAVRSAVPDRSPASVMEYVQRNTAQEGATQLGANNITFQELFGADNPLIHGYAGELYEESADDVLIDNRAAQDEWYQQFEKVTQPVNRVANNPLYEGGKALATQVVVKHELVQETARIVKHELVQETAQIVKQVGPGNKRGQKPKKKRGTSLPPSKDQTEKSPIVPAEKKYKKDQQDLTNEKTVFVALNTRRSQRVRKPKLKD